MKIEKIHFDAVRYNPESSAFEALVKIQDRGQIFSYPAQVAAALNAEFGIVARGLAQAARTAHLCASGQIRLHHAAPLQAAA